MAEKRYRLIISGRVQGVCFRFAAKRKADKLGILGWVRNTDDGGVEIICQGDKGRVDDFVEWCRKGPMLAKVRDIKIDEEKISDEFKSFSIRYSA